MTKHISVPDARERLRKLAQQLGEPELLEIAEGLYRRPATRRAAIKNQKLTPELAQEIRDYAAANPHMHQQDIANHFGVNVGRVSEALQGDK